MFFVRLYFDLIHKHQCNFYTKCNLTTSSHIEFIPIQAAHSQTEDNLLERVEEYFHRFPDVMRSIAVKIDYFDTTAPPPPADRARQRVRVWLFERRPQADAAHPRPVPPFARIAQVPPGAGLPAYPWDVGSAWANDPVHPPACGHYVIPLPTSVLASASHSLPPAILGHNFMVYRYLRSKNYVE